MTAIDTMLDINSISDSIQSIISTYIEMTRQLDKQQFGMLAIIPMYSKVEFITNRGEETMEINDISALPLLKVIMNLLESQSRNIDRQNPVCTDRLYVYSIGHCLETIVIMLTNTPNPSLSYIRSKCVSANILLNRIKDFNKRL